MYIYQYYFYLLFFFTVTRNIQRSADFALGIVTQKCD